VIDLGSSRMPQKILFFLVLGFSGVRCVQASGPPGWSVDLRKYGYQHWLNSRGIPNSSQTCLASTRDVIAVGLGNPVSKTPDDERSGGLPGANWEISLLLFDPVTGRLNAKRGPWTGDMSFELYSTSRGNLLLLLQHFHEPTGEVGETLYLLSPTGDELKKIFLAPSIVRLKQTWSTFLVSPSGHSVLIAQALEGDVHYKLLDADSLETKLEWTASAASNSPKVLAISDKELLGRDAPKATRTTGTGDRDRELYVRTFDGTWTSFPASLSLSHSGFGRFWISNLLSFLTDDTIVGVNKKRENAEASISVLRSDGTNVFSPTIPKLEPYTSLSGPVNVSQDGRHFAVVFTHRPWLSHLMLDVWKLDDTIMPEEPELLVWASSEPAPVAKFHPGSDLEAGVFSLGFDDPPSVVLMGSSTLRVIRAQPLR
jgi:hypothetical protein